MKWHIENRELFEQHCLLCAVHQGFVLAKVEVSPLLASGLVKEVTSFELTEAGEKELERVRLLLTEALEKEQS